MTEVGSAVEFSEVFACNSRAMPSTGGASFSSTGNYIASCMKNMLLVRDSESLEVVSAHTCVDTISRAEWSKDETRILCAMYSRGIIQVWNVRNPRWTLRLNDPLAPLTGVSVATGVSSSSSSFLVHARWCPDSMHFICTSDFGLGICIWKIEDEPNKQPGAKLICTVKSSRVNARGPCIAFTEEGDLMAVAVRNDCKDYIIIMTTSSWSSIKVFETGTRDLAGMQYLPNATLMVWDTCLLSECYIYGIEGKCLKKIGDASTERLGIKSVKLSTSGCDNDLRQTTPLVAIGSYSSPYVQIFNSLSWSIVASSGLSHSSIITAPSLIAYKETEYQIGYEDDSSSSYFLQYAPKTIKTSTKYMLDGIPITVKSEKPETDKPNPKMGVGLFSFNHDSTLIFTTIESMSNTLWIWEVQSEKLLYLVSQINEIKSAQWHPFANQIAILTGNNKLYLWAPSGCSCIVIPVDGFNAMRMEWSSDGKKLLLTGPDVFCCCYFC